MLHLHNGQPALKCGIISVWDYDNLFLTTHDAVTVNVELWKGCGRMRSWDILRFLNFSVGNKEK
jgi:hypothetical protein